jgi:hypothetical protein
LHYIGTFDVTLWHPESVSTTRTYRNFLFGSTVARPFSEWRPQLTEGNGELVNLKDISPLEFCWGHEYVIGAAMPELGWQQLISGVDSPVRLEKTGLPEPKAWHVTPLDLLVSNPLISGEIKDVDIFR